MKIWSGPVVISLLLLSCWVNTASSQAEGGVLTVATGFADIFSLVSSHVEEFYNLTGIQVIVTQRPFDSLFDDLLLDLQQGSPLFDMFILSTQWIVDFVDCKKCNQLTLIEPLSEYVRKDPEIDWLDVALFFRQYSAVYDGNIFSVPFDGDVHYLHVRKDILDQYSLPVPETWEEYLDVASKLHGKDMNNDSIPDFGSCIPMKKQSQAFYWPWTIFGSYIQSQGTQQGAFFDLLTMEPLIKNDGFAKAMSIYKSTGQYSPPDVLSIDVGATRDLFKQGRCAMTLDWANPFGFMSQSPYRDGYFFDLTPGSYEVVDRSTGKLVNCTRELCPYATTGRQGGLLNRAPYAAYGGWSGSISGVIPQTKKDNAYKFLSFMGKPATSSKDVTKGSGFDPYRYSHLNVTNWTEAGFLPAYVERMIGNFRSILSSPNLIIDMRIHASQKYQQTVFDPLAYDYVSGVISISDLQNRLFTQWEAVTEEQGRESQLTSYRATIGASKITACDSTHWNFTLAECISNQDVTAHFYWREPKSCVGGLSLPDDAVIGHCNFVLASTSVGTGLIVTATIVVVFLILMAVFVFIKRNSDSIRKSSWIFSFIIVCGGAMTATFVLASIGFPDIGSCIINVWILSLGYDFLFGGFLTKMYRIDRLLHAPLGKKVVFISDTHLARIMAALLVVDIALLAAWTWVAPSPAAITQTFRYTAEIVFSQKTCGPANTVTVALLFTYKALLLLYGGYLSFRTRKAPSEFSEHRFTSTAMIVVAFVSLVVIPLNYLLDSNRLFISSIGVLFASLTAVGIYIVPKLLHAFDIVRFQSLSKLTNTGGGGGGGTLNSSTRPSTGGGGGDVHVGMRSLNINASTMDQSYQETFVECPKCGHKFEI